MAQLLTAGPPVTEKICTMLSPSLEAMGYDIVRVQLSGNKRWTLQIMAERRDGDGMSVDDCETISHAVSALLDVEDPIEGAYSLEVSSPGIDRPLTRRQDFNRFAGFEAKVETDRLVEGRKRFRGRLIGIDEDDSVRIKDGEVEFVVPLAAITRAKLVLTDELLANSPDRPKM